MRRVSLRYGVLVFMCVYVCAFAIKSIKCSLSILSSKENNVFPRFGREKQRYVSSGGAPFSSFLLVSFRIYCYLHVCMCVRESWFVYGCCVYLNRFHIPEVFGAVGGMDDQRVMVCEM